MRVSRSLLRKQLILTIFNYSDFIWFTLLSMINHNKVEVFEDDLYPPPSIFIFQFSNLLKDLIYFNEIFLCFMMILKFTKNQGFIVTLENWSHPQRGFLYWVSYQCTEWSLNKQELFTHISLSFLRNFLKRANQDFSSES